MLHSLDLNEALLNWGNTWRFQRGSCGRTKVVGKGVPIFPRLDADVEIEYIRDQMAVTAPKEVEAPKEVDIKKLSEEISFDDFMNVDLRVATVTACEKVPKADKLLKLQLDHGL